MPYVGNSPASNFASVTKDTFSGDGSTTAFTLSKAATTNGVAVFVENVRQEPTTAYAVSGTTLTFTAAPVSSSGNNIYVLHHNTPASTATHPAAQGLTATSGTFTDNVTLGDNDKLRLGASNDLDIYHDGSNSFIEETGTGDLRVKGSVIRLLADNVVISNAANNEDMITAAADGAVNIRHNHVSCLTTTSDGGIDIEGGDIIFSTAGKGIVLGTTSNTDSNTLDDYEEGTWDVAVACGTSGSITIRSDYNEGYYNKVGTLVHAQGYIVVSGVSSPSGYISIGLPFAVANTSSEGGDWSTASVTIQGSAKNVNEMNATIISGGSQSILVYASDATTLQADSANAIAADDSMYFSCTYRSG